MSYETILEEVKTLPEQSLDELSSFINFLKFKTSAEYTSNDSPHKPTVPETKKAFFDAVGKISFDKESVEHLRERSVI
jgi:hypothetical protein